MKKITVKTQSVFTTADGETHLSAEAANEHQLRILFTDLMGGVWASNPSVEQRKEMVEVMVANRAELVRILDTMAQETEVLPHV